MKRLRVEHQCFCPFVTSPCSFKRLSNAAVTVVGKRCPWSKISLAREFLVGRFTRQPFCDNAAEGIQLEQLDDIRLEKQIVPGNCL